MDRVEPSVGAGAPAAGTGFDRRTMLKAAVAAGTIAGTWVAPRIETFGFAPAGAATLCQFTNPSTDDLNQNGGDNTYVSTASGRVRCPGNGSASFGPSGGQPDRIQFGRNNKPLLPASNCTQFVVRTRPQDCPPTTSTDVLDPDNTGFAVVVDLQETDSDCDCVVSQVAITDNMGTVATFTSALDPYPACNVSANGVPATGPGILVDFVKKGVNPCTIDTSARLRVTITCSTTGACPTL